MGKNKWGKQISKVVNAFESYFNVVIFVIGSDADVNLQMFSEGNGLSEKTSEHHRLYESNFRDKSNEDSEIC